ncbi:MnhB domain-containing protein [Nesterenkonia populi]|uniref:MnhB domain-containing protein n=1 Tax=Nesterenkonia populi TaxID=1591087 RepID=UPI0014789FB2|nr:MnhB domain-containing protein [Nesterenkonia populi]
MAEAHLLDWLLAATALAAAGTAVLPRLRIAQAMGFLVLGVVASLIWLRMGSVDVALAEAGLGGGLLGAVLVYLAAAPSTGTDERGGPAGAGRLRARLNAMFGIIAGATITVVLGAAWLRAAPALEETPPGWSEPLAEQMPGTGVEHEITGVLLAFRAYDTLLESGVLMLAALAALALMDPARLRDPAGLPEAPRNLAWMVRAAAPVLLVAGLWLLFAGSSDSGGAFQSGALLAALLILLRVAGATLTRLHSYVLRPALVVGVLAFIAAGLLGYVLTGDWLGWDPAWAFGAILTVEVLLTVGIAAGLYTIFLALEPQGQLEEVGG